MTVPQERFRALRWARNWLNDVAQDPLVPPQAKTEAESLLKAYPSDQSIRALITGRARLPVEMAESLSAASRWIFAFRHATSNPSARSPVLRHLPTPGEIAAQSHLPNPEDILVDRRLLASAHDWLEPDEDYVQTFVFGWLDDCAVAAGMEWADVREAELLEGARPLYLITSSTFGVLYQELELRQRLLCTVVRAWNDDSNRMWVYVKSCESIMDIPHS